MHSCQKVAIVHGDREINRIEVGLAREAAAQVCAGVDCGTVLVATWAEERELPLALLVRPVELL